MVRSDGDARSVIHPRLLATTHSFPHSLCFAQGYGVAMADDAWRIRSLADESEAAIAELAAQVLRDPLQAKRLSDRVYELMQQDLRIQQERSRGGGRF
jgi:hypothetical protein